MQEPDRRERVMAWVRENPLPTVCMIAGPIAGPFYAQFAFPDVELWRQVFGGAIAGGYFALCAIPHRYM